MRTTIRLDDALLRRAKAAAAAQGIPLTDLIADALRSALSPRPARRVSESTALNIPVFDGQGLWPGVDLDDSAALSPNAVLVQPGVRHWQLFTELCSAVDARGNLVADAYHAALAIEHGCEWITTDRDYARFPDLRWRHPLD